jgi:hypothetical protein
MPDYNLNGEQAMICHAVVATLLFQHSPGETKGTQDGRNWPRFEQGIPGASPLHLAAWCHVDSHQSGLN